MDKMKGRIGCKADSAKFVEYWVPVQISNVQLEQYCYALTGNSSLLRSSSKSDTDGVIGDALRDILVYTRQCCDHPYVADPPIQHLLMKDLPDPAVGCLDVGIKASGKLLLLDKLLTELKKQGLRVLILFQSIGSSRDSTGDILDDYLSQRFGEDSYERVDGGDIIPCKRQAALDNFNDKELGRFAILLENRACLPSVKLSSIDMVIIYGSDWNPANDLRNLQKVTMESQFQQIKIFRLYSSCTVEEKVLIGAKQGITLDSKLQGTGQRTSHMLLSWGAPYLINQLDEFHGSSSAPSIVSSSQSLINSVVQEFLTLLSQSDEDCVTKNSVIVKVQHTFGCYCAESPLIGEQKILSIAGELPRKFWSTFLDREHPCWKYVSGLTTSRKQRRVRLNNSLREKPEPARNEPDKKCKKDHKGSLELAKLHLSNECKKEEADYVYSTSQGLKKIFLQHRGNLEINDSSKCAEVSNTVVEMDRPGLKLSKTTIPCLQENVKVEVEDSAIQENSNNEVIPSPNLVGEFGLTPRDHSGSGGESQDEKQVERLPKQVEEVDAIYKMFVEKEALLEQYNMEAAVVRLLDAGSTRTEKLSKLDVEYSTKIKPREDELNTRLRKLWLAHLASTGDIQRESSSLEGDGHTVLASVNQPLSGMPDREDHLGSPDRVLDETEIAPINTETGMDKHGALIHQDSDLRGPSLADSASMQPSNVFAEAASVSSHCELGDDSDAISTSMPERNAVEEEQRDASQQTEALRQDLQDLPLVNESKQPPREGETVKLIVQMPSTPADENLGMCQNQAGSESAVDIAGGRTLSQVSTNLTTPIVLEPNVQPFRSLFPLASTILQQLHLKLLQDELERIQRERDQTARKHEDEKVRLRSDYGEEIEKITAQNCRNCDLEMGEIAVKIRRKYDLKLKEIEAEYLPIRRELELNHSDILMHKILAEAFGCKCMDLKTSVQRDVTSRSALQNWPQPSQVPGPSTVLPKTSTIPSAAFSPLSSQPMSPTMVSLPNVHPAALSVHNSSAVFTDVSSRPCQISHRMPPPAGSVQVPSEVSGHAPHLQAFRPSVASFVPPHLMPRQQPSTNSAPVPAYVPQVPPQAAPSHTGLHGRVFTGGLAYPGDSSSRLFTDSLCSPNASQMNDLASRRDHLTFSSTAAAATVEVICLSDDD